MVDASSFVSSMLPAINDAVMSCPVSVKSISELSVTVTASWLAAVLAAISARSAVVRILLVAVSAKSSMSSTTTPTSPLTDVTVPPTAISAAHAAASKYALLVGSAANASSRLPMTTPLNALAGMLLSSTLTTSRHTVSPSSLISM